MLTSFKKLPLIKESSHFYSKALIALADGMVHQSLRTIILFSGDGLAASCWTMMNASATHGHP